MLEVRNLFKIYKTKNGADVKALDGVSLQFPEKGMVFLLGKSGSGKSTLAKLITGLLKPAEGTVLVDGMSTLEENYESEIHRRVGLVFQNPDNQIVATIVEEDVAFGPENLGLEPPIIRKRVDDALKAVDMYDFKDHAPHKLSGGQKQRVAIAGVIAMEPECIVLDEPTAMLDPRGRSEVINTIYRLNKEKGITVLLITHYMEEAENADRIVVMDKGKIVADGAPKAVFADVDTIKSVGLDVPQTTELLYLLKKSGFKTEDGVISIEDCEKQLKKLLSEV